MSIWRMMCAGVVIGVIDLLVLIIYLQTPGF